MTCGWGTDKEAAVHPPSPPRDALEGKGPQGRPQEQLSRRLEAVAKAVVGDYCRLQMPLSLALGVRETVAEHRLEARERHTERRMSPELCLLLMALLCSGLGLAGQVRTDDKKVCVPWPCRGRSANGGGGEGAASHPKPRPKPKPKPKPDPAPALPLPGPCGPASHSPRAAGRNCRGAAH